MPMLVTMATLQRSNARPSRRMPPRAVSNTAASTSGVHEHAAGAARAAAVARVDAQVVDVHAVGIGHADAVAGAQQMRGQAHGGGLAVGAGHRHDRDAAIFAVGVHVGDDGLAHIAALAEGRIQVHAQAGRGIDFHHAAVLFLQRIQHARRRRCPRRRCPGRSFGRPTRRAAISGWTSSVTSVAEPPVLRLALLRRKISVPGAARNRRHSPVSSAWPGRCRRKRILVSEVAWPSRAAGRR